MTSSSSFLMLASTAFVLLVAILMVSIIVGLRRQRAGHELSAEIEQAAGMEGRWRTRSRPEPATRGEGRAGEDGHAAA